MTPTRFDHLIAMAAHMEVFAYAALRTADAVTRLGPQLRRSAAQSIRTLSRAERVEYWRLRQIGMFPFDALAMIDD